MARYHPSTPLQRSEWVLQLLAQAGEYGAVSRLSQEAGAARQTLYRWRDQGRAALEQAFTPAMPAPGPAPELSRAVLTLLVEAHPSERGIQTSLRLLTGQAVGLGTIAGIIQDAGRRAQQWLATQAPAGRRPLALDEIYGNARRGAYLHIVDTASGAVWAAQGPSPVDTETWTLVLWEAQARGLRWQTTVSDGGAAIEAALRSVDPDGAHGRDVWHVFHVCRQVQGRLERRVTELVAQTSTVARQAARVAAGQRPRGRRPRTDLAAHQAEGSQAQAVAAAVRYLTQVLHDLLAVVVVTPSALLDEAARRDELAALLTLLAEVAATAPPGPQREVERLHRHVSAALPGLLAFVAPLDRVHQEAARVLGWEGVALVAWAWQRRALLGPDADTLVAQFPPAWQGAARLLLTAWEGAVRASSAVENWHSILRPPLAVHRTLTPGLLALLAVWHNHRVFTRGARAGSSPLHLSGVLDAPTDWLLALGYPPADAPASPAVTALPPAPLAEAA